MHQMERKEKLKPKPASDRQTTTKTKKTQAKDKIEEKM